MLFKQDEVGNQIIRTVEFDDNKFKNGHEYEISIVFCNTNDLDNLNYEYSYDIFKNLDIKE